MNALLRRARRLPAARVDALLALAIGIAGVVEFATRIPAAERTLLPAVLLAGAYGCLAFRRRAPIPAAVGMYALFVTMNFVLVSLAPLNVPLFAVLLMSWTLGRHVAGTRAAAAGLALVVVGMTLIILGM